MTDDSASSSRPSPSPSPSPRISDTKFDRFLHRLTREQFASLADRAQHSLSGTPSPTHSERSAPSASSRRSGRSRLSRASGTERGRRGRGCCGDQDDVDTSASRPISQRGTPCFTPRSSSRL